MDSAIYSAAFRVSYVVFAIPTILVFITALLSAREMGGTLGKGIKKVAAGSIIHTTLIMTYLALERGYHGILGDYWVGMFFLSGGILGSVLLVSGYLQVYKITKEFKLFTP